MSFSNPKHRLEAPDLVVVGGGIVGLATAWSHLERDRCGHGRVTVLEKEALPATHQTGRNSGVVHSGLYYPRGSLKALTCARGSALLEGFCAREGVPFERCGKVVIATKASEVARLDDLARCASLNGLEHARLDADELRALEPHAAGIAALHVPSTAIVDYVAVCAALVHAIESSGRGRVVTRAFVRSVERLDSGAMVHLKHGPALQASHVVNCAGLFSDRVARRSGHRTDTRIVPFRGEYFRLTRDAEHMVRGLIYPVPDARFPFLGVHFTRMASGGVECGPNAVFALAREGYRWNDVSPRDLASALSWPGTWKLFARHWRSGAAEAWRSFSKAAFVRALQRLVPEVRAHHLEPIPAGVRAQAVDRQGALVDDFVVERDGPILHVLNAPSPAATASLAIAEHILESLAPRHHST